MFVTQTIHTVDIFDKDLSAAMKADFGVVGVNPCDVRNDTDHITHVELDDSSFHFVWDEDTKTGECVPPSPELVHKLLLTCIQEETNYSTQKTYKTMYLDDAQFVWALLWMHFNHNWPIGEYCVRVSW